MNSLPEKSRSEDSPTADRRMKYAKRKSKSRPARIPWRHKVDKRIHQLTHAFWVPFMFLGKKTRKQLRKIFGTLHDADRWSDNLFRILSFPLLLVLLPIVAVLSFLHLYRSTRRWKQMLICLPPALIAAPVVWLVGQSVLTGDDQLVRRYQNELLVALDDRELNRIGFLEKRLSQFGRASRAVEYRIAIGLSESGSHQEALERMKMLAPVDKPGFAAAHMWLATRYLQVDSPGIQQTDATRLCARHLEFLEQSIGPTPELLLLSGALAAKTGEFETALKTLYPFSRESLPAAGIRMHACLMLQRLEDARHEAGQVLKLRLEQQRKGKQPAPREYLWFYTAFSILNDEDQAAKTLESWFTDWPDDPVCRKTKTNQLLSKYDSLIRTASATSIEPAQLLAEASRVSINPLPVHARVMAAIDKSGFSDFFLRNVEALKQELDPGFAVLDAIGTASIEDKQWREAVEYLTAAAEQNPSAYSTWNNLAYAIYSGFPDRNEEARSAAEKAKSLNSNNPLVCGTLGLILVQKGDWGPAVIELRQATECEFQSAEIHTALAQAYDATGEHLLAEQHMKIAESLKFETNGN